MLEDERWVEDQDEGEDALDMVVARPLAGGSSVPIDGSAPGWIRPLTPSGKLRRGLVTTCVVAVAIVTLLAPALASFAASSDVAGRLSQAWSAPPAPTERPQPTRTARAAVVAQPAESAWTAIALPPGAIYSQIVASPLDPRVVFACIWPSADAGTNAQFWRTRDAGATWSTAALPAHSGEDCALSSAPDATGRILALLSHSDSSQSACAASWLYVSSDDGGSWGRAPHTPVGPSGASYMRCEAWRAGAHLYFQIWYALPSDPQPLERAILERSDDDGRSWSRIDGAFSAQASGNDFVAGGAHFRAWPFSDGDTLLASVVTPDGSAIWLSRDTGRDWAHIGVIANVYTTNLVLDTSAYQTRPAPDHPVYATSNEQLPPSLFRLRAYASADGAQWTQLPPLPVPGANPTRTGLTQVGGATARGGLLALGVNPQTGVPGGDDQDTALKAATQSQWIWRWDPHNATWTAVAPAPAECAKCRLAGATTGVSADGATSGTYLWLEDQAQGARALYRYFLATPGRATRGK
jgi:hypothetical protein